MPARAVILAVDDNAPLCQVYLEALRPAGYLVFSASDGATALEIVAEFPDAIDLLLVELHLPDMAGPTLVRRAGLSVPVLYVSGDDLAVHRLRADGPHAVLQKPFLLTELLDAVTSLCGGAPDPDGTPDPAA